MITRELADWLAIESFHWQPSGWPSVQLFFKAFFSSSQLGTHGLPRGRATVSWRVGTRLERSCFGGGGVCVFERGVLLNKYFFLEEWRFHSL